MNISEKVGSSARMRIIAVFFQPHDVTVGHGHRGRHAPRLPGQAGLAAEFVRPQYRDDDFLALLGDDSELHLALLYIEDRIRSSALRKDLLFPVIEGDGSAGAFGAQKRFEIEERLPLDFRKIGSILHGGSYHGGVTPPNAL